VHLTHENAVLHHLWHNMDSDDVHVVELGRVSTQSPSVIRFAVHRYFAIIPYHSLFDRLQTPSPLGALGMIHD
jgi:hypothetical protein